MSEDIRSILERNLSALAATAPDLADLLRSRPGLGEEVFEPSRAGPPTARLSDEAGRPVQLASRIDPLREARRLVEAHLMEGPTVYLVVGFGLGYHVAELLRRCGPEDRVVVAEGNLDLMRSVLERQDFSSALAERRLRLVTTADRAELARSLKDLTAALLMGTRLIVHPPTARLEPGFERSFRRAFTDFLAAQRVNLATLATNTYITVHNLLMNLPAYVRNPGLGHLEGVCAGWPAVVVSAGPSLARNIHLLAEAADRMVVIAVATTLKLLLRRGIRPHFVTCLDYHEVSKRFFEGVEARDIFLVVEPKAAWQVLEAWRGPMGVVGNEFLDACLRDLDPPLRRVRLPAGSTVAHLAFYLARFLGADPIVLVGQDLGYSDGLYYIPGTAVHDTWRPELNRFWTLEMKEWERIMRRRPMLRTIEDIHGRPIYTDEQMFTYLVRFEADFRRTSARVIDATEGGARKAGAEVMSLAEVVRRWGRRSLPADLRERLLRSPPDEPDRTDEVRRALLRRIEETRAIGEICRDAQRTLNRLGRVLGDEEAAKPLFQHIDHLRAEVDRRSEAYLLVRSFAQADQLRRYQADRRIAAAQVGGVERQRLQLQRDLEYVTSLAADCDLFCGMLESALRRLETGCGERFHLPQSLRGSADGTDSGGPTAEEVCR